MARRRVRRSNVGLTSVVVRISNPADRSRALEAEMLVDSGAIFSVAPADELAALGIQPEKVERFGGPGFSRHPPGWC